MLEQGQRAIARAGLGARVRLAQGDASAFDLREIFGVNTVDRVFISYALSMIPPWQRSVEAGLAVLGAGGELSCVDFGQMQRFPAVVRGPFRAWLAAFHVTPRPDLAEVIEAAAERHGARARVDTLHGGYAVYGRVSGSALSGSPTG
jgi:S-adenosylmethionine-diacylgycerolhomoserine-N-methlytransferase